MPGERTAAHRSSARNTACLAGRGSRERPFYTLAAAGRSEKTAALALIAQPLALLSLAGILAHRAQETQRFGRNLRTRNAYASAQLVP